MQLEIDYPIQNTPTVKFLSLASGSSGNCYYLGYGKHGILIDAGIGVRTIKKRLKDVNIAMESILGVLVTHDHADHIKSVGNLGEKLHIPIYTTAHIHEGINKSYCVTEKLYSCVRYIKKEEPTQIAAFNITAFEVPHDGTDNVGYYIEVGGKNFSFLTDLGEITPLAAHYINKAHYLILEANYDDEMLRMGTYPEYLKQRITGSNGHLSNNATADFLAENINEHLQHIWLCHLSKDNNHPELAYKTVEYKLRAKGIIPGKDVQLVALKRNTASELYEWE
ncbi:MBL fold metallo-hydrolase [Bacteroides sp. 214]|uniref:MBL fold metallo-hydrolase n=1 Tax=Bacteroides sp. 214 TaxID=2302935 RepID=UPI0013D6353E|nr:MBL fold metallo-hydrolase [Bacteroides sp. 214]NDW11557.1 MBL fold metallo-hydrolase [Bacteroides sp. 214]